MAQEISIEEEPTNPQDVRQFMAAELDRVIERFSQLKPDYTPPPFSPRKLIEMIETGLQHVAPHTRLDILQKLRESLNEDIFDIETWKGAWFLFHYSVQYQLDIFKRRFTGEYEPDAWGMDAEFMETVKPLLNFLYRFYWRIQVQGLAHIPDYSRALLAANHAGALPFDSLMIGTAVANDHPSQRTVRYLHDSSLSSLPFLSSFFTRMGHTSAHEANGLRLLQADELVGIFPEGIHGLTKPYTERYNLIGFKPTFAKMALATGAPIVPTAVVGSEETTISLFNADWVAKALGLSAFPVSATFPWLGLLGLVPFPTQWQIAFGEPILTEGLTASKRQIADLTEQTRLRVQALVDDLLEQRESLLSG